MTKAGDKSRLSVSWRAVAVSSVLLNAGLVAAVAAISASEGAGALTTVALALAVIAFICQLIIFVIQTTQSGAQLKQAQELNASTLGLMTEVKGRVQNTEHLVQTQYQELVALARGANTEKAREVVSEIVVRSVAGEALTPEEARAAQVALEMLPVEAVAAGEPPKTAIAPSEHPAMSWPDDVADLRAFVDDLGAMKSITLSLFAHDLSADLKGAGIALSMSTDEEPLVEAGYLTDSDRVWDEVDEVWNRTIVLTTKGRAAGAVLIAKLPPPSTDPELALNITQLRARLTKRARRTLELTVERLHLK